MVNHKTCKYYADCDYRNGAGECPDRCVQYKHKDAVIVVRCKDCKACPSFDDNGTGYCLEHRMDVLEDDFCSYGERREGE